jgi:hypothetical protein
MSEHLKYAPSSMSRTVQCNGWIGMSEGVYERETDDSKEGTAVHELIERVLEEFKMRNSTYVIHWDTFINDVASNGIVYDEEMVDAARLYVEYVVSVVAKLSEMNVEQKVMMPIIHPENGGTPDADWHDKSNHVIHVFDFKYGHGSVSAFENWQAMDYAVGILLREFSPAIFSEDKMVITIKIHIIQPRCYHDNQGPYRTWQLTHHELYPYLERMREACEGDGVLQTGDQCTHCPAQFKCPANKEATRNALDVLMKPEPDMLTEEALGYEYHQLLRVQDLIKCRKAAIESDITDRIKIGLPVPGCRLEPSFGNRKWIKDESEVVALGKMFDVDLLESKLVSPAGAEKLLKKKDVDASVINDYHSKTNTGLKLKADDGSKAKMIFGRN